MVQANELRIGNYIASSHELTRANKETWVIGKVNSIGNLECEFEQIEVETDESFTWFFKNNYFGIPLTEEVLSKCGFRNFKNSFFIERLGSLYFSKPFKECLWYNVKTDGGDKITTVTYLHELQNLYYALTGQELEVKL